MIRVLGVDGGQSGIRLAHSDGPEIVEVAGVSRLEGDVVQAVADAVSTGWMRGDFAPVQRVVLGLTTAPVIEDEANRLCRLVAQTTGADEVWLADDTVTSHVGALSATPGVSLIAGTGIACLAIPKSGPPHTVDGHGYLLGDAGGAFWIGSRGLRGVLRAHDGRGPSTSMTADAELDWGALEGLHVRLHGGERPVNAIAQFAKRVLSAAGGGDPLATAIIERAAQELLITARAGLSWAGQGAPFAVGGRLLGTGSPLRTRLDHLLAVEEIRYRSADASGLAGAIQLGRSDNLSHYAPLVRVWKAGNNV